MTRHLSENQLEDLIHDGMHKLDPLMRLHFEQCEFCQGKMDSQSRIDRLLKNLRPQASGTELYQHTLSRLEILERKDKKDWWFIIAMGLLVVIALYVLIVYPQIGLSEKGEMIPPQIDTGLGVLLEDIRQIINLPAQAWLAGLSIDLGYVVVSLFALIVLMFYFFVDHYFKPRIQHKSG